MLKPQNIADFKLRLKAGAMTFGIYNHGVKIGMVLLYADHPRVVWQPISGGVQEFDSLVMFIAWTVRTYGVEFDFSSAISYAYADRRLQA